MSILLAEYSYGSKPNCALSRCGTWAQFLQGYTVIAAITTLRPPPPPIKTDRIDMAMAGL
jgi:hypothetical protein